MGYDNSYGHFIVIEDGSGNYHWYCHLSHIYVVEGQWVDRNDHIAEMGASGNVTGRHLHYEIRDNSNLYGHVLDVADYMGIPNQVGTYNSNNYPVYRSHVQDVGDQDFVVAYNVSGTTGEAKRVEAIQIMSDEIEYRVHLQDKGWTGWVRGGTYIGTTGESRRLEAIEIRSSRTIVAQAHVQDIGWQNEQIGNDIEIGTTGQSLRLEAFRFRFA